MIVKESVECRAEGEAVQKIRSLACILSREEHPEGYNAMIETNFNHMLQDVVQEAFNSGREYEKRKCNNLLTL